MLDPNNENLDAAAAEHDEFFGTVFGSEGKDYFYKFVGRFLVENPEPGEHPFQLQASPNSENTCETKCDE